MKMLHTKRFTLRSTEPGQPLILEQWQQTGPFFTIEEDFILQVRKII
jgi:hypothetical protein